MKYCTLTLALLLCGCGTFSNPISDVLDRFKISNATPEQIEAIGNTVSNTGMALSYFVIGGCILVLAGIIMLAFSGSKHAGIILIVGGASSAFVGYTIEEYALYTLIATGFAGIAYGGFILGNKWGYKLGFENGKDFNEENK